MAPGVRQNRASGRLGTARNAGEKGHAPKVRALLARRILLARRALACRKVLVALADQPQQRHGGVLAHQVAGAHRQVGRDVLLAGLRGVRGAHQQADGDLRVRAVR